MTGKISPATLVLRKNQVGITPPPFSDYIPNNELFRGAGNSGIRAFFLGRSMCPALRNAAAIPNLDRRLLAYLGCAVIARGIHQYFPPN
jgi:hypothetical protein